MIKIYHNATNALVLGGGNAPLNLAYYQTRKYQTYESISQKSIILGQFSPKAVIRALKMLGQSKKNQSARNANPYKSFCYFWLLPKVESLYPTDSNPQSETDFHHLANVRNISLCERVL